MKIGFDISTLGIHEKTGIGHYQYNLLQNLFKIDSKNQYNLYAFNLRDNYKYDAINFDAPYGNVEKKAHKIPQRTITAWWMLSRWPLLEQIVGKCDIYQISEICQQPTNAKTVSFIHDLTTILFPKHHLIKNRILYHHRFKNIKKYATAVLVNSENTKKDAIELLKIDPERIFVTYLGVDSSFKPATDKEKTRQVLCKYSIEGPYICYLGTIEPRKNLTNLIEAFNRVKKQEKIPHKLVIVGKKGWFYKNVFKKVEDLKLMDEVIFTGFVEDEDRPYILSGADLFVYPSFYEGFGLPILEAMACGTPVATSGSSSLPEIAQDAAVYFNPCNPEDIAAKILKLINNLDERKRLSELGMVRAKNFSWAKCAKETLSVYEKI